MPAAGLKGRVCCPAQCESFIHRMHDIPYPADACVVLCSSELLGHLARFKECHLTPPYHHAPEENDMRGIISEIANCAMSTVCLLCQPCRTLAQLFVDQHRL